MRLIDSHCHLDFSIFDKDREILVEQAKTAHVERIIVPSVAKKNWPTVTKIASQYPAVAVAYGLHPMFMKHHKPAHLYALRQQIEKNNPVAVGECGLDFYITPHHKTAQIEIFIQHLKLADEFSLPLIIHARKSLDIVLKYIRKFTGLRGVIHSFSGSQQQAEICIEKGFLLGFGGAITYTRANKLRKLVVELPLESLLLETDAPDQPDSEHAGQRNVPANLINIAQQVAELRNTELSEIARVTTQNATVLFNLD